MLYSTRHSEPSALWTGCKENHVSLNFNFYSESWDATKYKSQEFPGSVDNLQVSYWHKIFIFLLQAHLEKRSANNVFQNTQELLNMIFNEKEKYFQMQQCTKAALN